MGPLSNPFSPGAGAPPPELVGRSPLLEQARILVGRVRRKRAEKSMLLTGLRGVGKTVLLREMERIAKADGYRTIMVEAREPRGNDVSRLGELLIPPLKNLLFDLDRVANRSEKVRRGFAVLRAFLGTVKVSFENISVGLDIDPERGSADSGKLEFDLPNLFVAVAEAAADRDTAIALLIDEVQYLETHEFGALIMAMHRLQQLQLPFVLVGAGLPILPAMAGESKSYAERLFSFPEVGALTPDDATRAIRDPMRKEGVEIDDAAIAAIVTKTVGYPYFLQEWGYQVWTAAESSPIGLAVVTHASPQVERRLDENFFRVRFDRLTPGEKSFLRAMAELGAGPYRIAEVADQLDVKVTSLGPRRAQLIKKGMIYSPAHGELAFTVPLFDEFMRRSMPGGGYVDPRLK